MTFCIEIFDINCKRQVWSLEDCWPNRWKCGNLCFLQHRSSTNLQRGDKQKILSIVRVNGLTLADCTYFGFLTCNGRCSNMWGSNLSSCVSFFRNKVKVSFMRCTQKHKLAVLKPKSIHQWPNILIWVRQPRNKVRRNILRDIGWSSILNEFARTSFCIFLWTICASKIQLCNCLLHIAQEEKFLLAFG